MKGTLFGVGVGPGDPELMTLKDVYKRQAIDQTFSRRPGTEHL